MYFLDLPHNVHCTPNGLKYVYFMNFVVHLVALFLRLKWLTPYLDEICGT